MASPPLLGRGLLQGDGRTLCEADFEDIDRTVRGSKLHEVRENVRLSWRCSVCCVAEGPDRTKLSHPADTTCLEDSEESITHRVCMIFPQAGIA